ncbi:MAG: type II toxin-antitoxin system prevent-host-death family antitoxin [Acidobacteriota bacterium]|nr:type II toxin-antitoxin system prevent-host-death family antitoxin [Acidobacteriota bacterium]MDE3264862.1 type II toxin-antitoxin system prevent-host-death family antitoxin [Acidobacteriota bacterium]
MHQVNIHEAKTHLSRLIREALEGEEVVIAKGNRPLVRLDVLPEARGARRLGTVPGLIVRMDEDFDAPLEDFDDYS